MTTALVVLLGRISANLRAYDQPSTNGYLALDDTIVNPQSGALAGGIASARSPDGTQIALISDQRVSTSSYLINADGSGPVGSDVSTSTSRGHRASPAAQAGSIIRQQDVPRLS